MTENGVVLTSFIVKSQKKIETIITHAIITAINFTAQVFSTFLKIEPIENGYIENIYLEKPEIILNELMVLKSNVYKDIHISLIDSLIKFYKNIPAGGTIQFKHYNFEIIWEEMVHYYLCNHFIGFENSKLKFSDTPDFVNKFEKHKEVQINSAFRFKNIILDHYYQTDKFQYLFDSKYYIEVKEMNFKQISYGFSLKNMIKPFNETGVTTVNVLFLPGNKEQNIHFALTDDLSYCDGFNNLIFEYYIDVELLIMLYTNS